MTPGTRCMGLPGGIARLVAGVLLAAGIGLAPGPAAAADETLELRVKAAFLFNFAKFLTWPAGKFAAADSPIEVCILKPGPFGPIIDDLLQGKMIEGRPLTLLRLEPDDPSLRHCHLLYASQRHDAVLEAVFARLADSGVMTVHEGPAALPGGVARLYVEERKVHFEINTLAAEREGLQVSSRLLSVARVVQR